jgi:hypothetical protein
MINAYKILVGKPEGRRLFGRPRSRLEDVRIGLGEIGWEGVDRIYLVQDRDKWWPLVNMIMNFRVP